MSTDTTARPAPVSFLSRIAGGASLKQFGILGALILIIVVFEIWTGGKTLSSGNVINIVRQNAHILILAIGMVMVIIAGHIDLSVGSVAAFSGLVVAISVNQQSGWGLPWWVGILIGLVVGALIGAWQGFWVAYVGVPAFIVTLAGMLMWRGANQLLGQSKSFGVPADFVQPLAGYLPEWGPDTGFNNSTLLLGLLVLAALVYSEFRARAKRKRMGAAPDAMWVTIVRIVVLAIIVIAATLLFASGRIGTSFPLPGIILGVLVLAYGFLTRNTALGRHVYAVGGNRHAAELSGVNSKRTDFFVMMNMSVLAAVAGMLFVARSQASGPQDGSGWELDAIASVFIGGAAVAGGIGTIGGSIIGGLVMAVLNNGLQLEGISAEWVQIVKGLVLLVAVGIDVYNKSQGRPSLTGRLFASKQERGAAKEGVTPATQQLP